MSALLPDWLVVLATMLAIAVFVTGRVRLAALLAAPALLRFVFWPAVLALLSGIPVFVLVILGVLVLPIIIVQGARQLLILFVGSQATDHAIGHAVGEGLVRFLQRRRK